MCEDCDWPSFILCCCEILCVCCVNCADSAPKCTNTQETNFTNPVNPNGTYIAQQPLNQGYPQPLNQGYPYTSQQQQYFPQGYSPEQQFSPSQQFGVQQHATSPNSGLQPTAPFPENNYASNQSTGGIASSNYPAPPPSYAEAVGMDTITTPSSHSPNVHISKA